MQTIWYVFGCHGFPLKSESCQPLTSILWTCQCWWWMDTQWWYLCSQSVLSWIIRSSVHRPIRWRRILKHSSRKAWATQPFLPDFLSLQCGPSFVWSCLGGSAELFGSERQHLRWKSSLTHLQIFIFLLLNTTSNMAVFMVLLLLSNDTARGSIWLI